MRDVPSYGTFDQNVREALATVGKPSLTILTSGSWYLSNACRRQSVSQSHVWGWVSIAGRTFHLKKSSHRLNVFSSARAAASFSRLLSKTLRSPLSSLRARTDSCLLSSARVSASPSPSFNAVIPASAASARACSSTYRRFHSSGGGTDGMTASQTGSPEFNMRPD